MKTKTPLQEGKALAALYTKDWKKAKTAAQHEDVDNGILEVIDDQKIKTFVFCTGGPHLELAIVYNEERILFAIWTYKDWGTCDRWVADEQDIIAIENIWSHLPEFYA